MSLQVWLPLNGNLNNQGLSNVNINSSSAIFSNNGKMGSCLSINNYWIGNFTINEIAHKKDFSCCFWFKITDSNCTEYKDLITFGINSTTFRCEIHGSTSRVAWFGNNAITESSGAYAVSITPNIWYHMAVTINGNCIYTFLNGELKQRYNIPSQFLNYDFTGVVSIGDTAEMHCDYNDIRIYDHCLSPKEVKEISKGLILHYPLKNPYREIAQNLCTTGTMNRTTCYNGAIGKYNYGEGTDIYREEYYESGMLTTKVFNKTSNVKTWNYVFFDNLTPAVGGYKTLSFDFYPTAQTKINFYSYNTNGEMEWRKDGLHGTGGTIDVVLNKWNHIQITIKNTGTTTSGFGYMRMGTGTYDSNPSDYWLFRNIMLQEGNQATGYVQANFPYDNEIEYDCSGFENNGTVTGSVLLKEGSPRYENNYLYSASNGSILIGNLATMVPEGNFTFNIWFRKYTDEWSSKGYETILGGPSGFELEMKNSTTNTPTLFLYSWGKGTYQYTLDEWHMLTMTRTPSKTCYYIDGEKILEGTAGSIPSGNYYIGSWRDATSQNYRGSLSDVRIYTTVLSEEDIKALYNVRGSIDNLGNTYAFEIKEE